MRIQPARAAIAAAFAFLIGVLTFVPVVNNDVFLHLTTGGLILDRGAVPWTDEYTCTANGSPYIAHEWLAQMIFALIHRVAGFAGLNALVFVLTGMTLWITWRVCLARLRASGHSPGADAAGAVAAVTLAAVTLLLTISLSTRPHQFTFLLAAAFLWILPRVESEDGRAARSAMAVLCVLQVVWVNLHGAFVIGVMMAALQALAFGVVARRPTRSAAVVPMLGLATLLNPYGWHIWDLVARFREPFFREAIPEWQSPFDPRYAASPLFWIYLGWIGVLVVAAARIVLGRGGRGGPARVAAWTSLLIVLVFAVLSVLSRRHITLLALAGAPLIADVLASWWLRRGKAPHGARGGAGTFTAAGGDAIRAAMIAAGVPATLRALYPRPGAGVDPSVPVEALEVMRAEGMKGCVFTTIGFGAYVTWAGWSDLLTSVDSRLEVFGGARLREAMIATRDAGAFRAAARGGRYDLALLSWQWRSMAGALEALSADPEWHLVYFDDLAALYARILPGREPWTARRAFRTIDPVRFMQARGFDRSVSPAAAEREARRAAADPPRLAGRPAMNTVSNLMLGTALLMQGRFQEAIPPLSEVLEADPSRAPAWELIARARVGAGDVDGAREALRTLRGLVEDPGRVDDLLRRIDEAAAHPE